MGTGQLFMDLNYQRDIAAQIAADAGVLRRCEAHDTYIQTLCGDNESAYRLGSARITAGEYKNTFWNRRAMTDAVDWAVQNAGIECYFCERLLDD